MGSPCGASGQASGCHLGMYKICSEFVQFSQLAEPIAIGDKVLIRNFETLGLGKWRSYWFEEVYIVKDIKNNGVV